MNKVRTAENIVTKLRNIEISVNQRETIANACWEFGISDHTYYKWRKECGGLEIDQVKELKKLKEENLRLKKAVTDLTMDKFILNEALSVKF